MRDIVDDIDRWLREGRSMAIATVVETWGSSPRTIGAKMVISSSGDIGGSVSGGCIESAVAERGLAVLQGESPQLLRFGVSDDEAWDVGLACGGTIEVFIEALDGALYSQIFALMSSDDPFITATIIDGIPGRVGRKMVIGQDGEIVFDSTEELADLLQQQALAQLVINTSGRRRIVLQDTDDKHIDVFFEITQPASELVLVGGVHIAIALCRIAREIGFRTVVIDPRRAFGSAERFGVADRLIQEWPSEAFKKVSLTGSTAVALLTHDPKIDDPAAIHTLSSPAFYVGALGSQKTHAARRQRLLKAGVAEKHIDRLHAPIGVNIGARSPEEIAVAIMAEIIEVKNAR